MTLATDKQSLQPDSLVELFVLDATALGGSINRFHSGLNEKGESVVWAGNTYDPMPIAASGFEKSGEGVLPRPKLVVSNIGGLVAALVNSYDDLVGATLTRIRTLVKYLDAVNFYEGNPLADSSVKFDDEVYEVNQKTKENKSFIEFELAASWDVQGVKLPKRQMLQNVCSWVYRSAECSYAGGAVAKEDDTPTAILEEDECGKRVASCKLRFGSVASLPFGGFPAVGLIR